MVEIKLDSIDVQRALKKVNKDYRDAFQLVAQKILENIRIEAAMKIIPNTTGFRNPSMARMRQAPTNGRLTERTGKTIWMLKESADRGGGGFNGTVRKVKQTSALEMAVGRTLKGKAGEEYNATIKFNLTNMHGRLASQGDKRPQTFAGGKKIFPQLMPKETRDSLYFRFRHDTHGVKGGAKRMHLSLAAEENMTDLRRLASDRWDSLITEAGL